MPWLEVRNGVPFQPNNAISKFPAGSSTALKLGSAASMISNPTGFNCEATVSMMLWRRGFGSRRPILIDRRWPSLTRTPSAPAIQPAAFEERLGLLDILRGVVQVRRLAVVLVASLVREQQPVTERLALVGDGPELLVHDLLDIDAEEERCRTTFSLTRGLRVVEVQVLEADSEVDTES